MQKFDFHRHSYLYALGIGRIYAFYPGVYPSSVVQLHNPYTVRVFSIVALCRHGGRRDVDAGEGGELSFPIQVAILLSEPGRDFTGGEFVLTEQRPRMQSRVEVVPLRQGDAVVSEPFVFTTSTAGGVTLASLPDWAS